jgi:hypothetical protein
VSNEGAILNALTAAEHAVPVGVTAAAKPIETYIKAKVSIPYPPPSKPGSPPHRRTGRFQRNWRVRGLGKTLQIRNHTYYGPFLEAGTSIMAARPTLSGFAGNLTGLVSKASQAGINAGGKVRR